MIQTALLENAHDDLVTDAAYDYYGLKLATCSLDQRIKIWQMDENTRGWVGGDDWKAHDATVSKVAWAHPEFGTILATSSFDRTVKIWENVVDGHAGAANGAGPSSRWVEKAVLVEARGTVRYVEFAPRHYGLKLATVASDSYLRIYECLEPASLTTWQLLDEIDVTALSPRLQSRMQTHSIGTPIQTSLALEGGASASLVAQALANQQPGKSVGMNNKEADGGWCLSWCKERYWGEVLAVGCGTSGVVHVIHLSASRRAATLLALDPHPSASDHPTTPSSSHAAQDALQSTSKPKAPAASKAPPHSSAVVTVSWAPSCGRSYHLVATGGRDGHIRIWKLKPESDDDEEGEGGWSAGLVADFEDHGAPVGKVEWNITGSVLSSVGNDGQVRLWKAMSGGAWRAAGTIGVEQADEKEGDRKSVV